MWTTKSGKVKERIYGTGPYNHPPVPLKPKLNMEARLKYEDELHSGSSASQVYKKAVATAADPLDSTTVPTKEQLQNIKRQVTKEHLPHREVSF